MKVDLKKLNVATIYVERMAEGRNPVNNHPFGENDVMNNPNIIRCMYFVHDILEAVADCGGEIGAVPADTKTKEQTKRFPFEVLDGFSYKEDQSITHLLSQIMELVSDPDVRPFTHYPITVWLKDHGYLYEKVYDNGQKATVPTELGESIGMYLEHRKSFRGDEYDVVMYKRQAQEFVVKNFKSMIFGKEIATESVARDETADVSEDENIIKEEITDEMLEEAKNEVEGQEE